jgi:small nuclear ribonucleoprotein D3
MFHPPPHKAQLDPTTTINKQLQARFTMSVVGNNRVGIPIVLLHDAEGAVITVETQKGELIRGLLFEAEDMMNLYIKNAIVTDVNGVKRKTNQVYLRGPEIVFIILPDMLKHAPMFQRYVFSFLSKWSLFSTLLHASKLSCRNEVSSFLYSHLRTLS